MADVLWTVVVLYIEHEFARNTVDMDIRSERCRTNLSSRPRGNGRLDHVNADNPLTRAVVELQ